MKKIIYIIILSIIVIVSLASKAEGFIIPNEAIRLRVIANSNSNIDKQVKLAVKNRVEKDVYNLLDKINDYDKAKEKLSTNLKNIENGVIETLKLNKADYGYDLNFGMNYFPAKEYKGVEYKAGNYESLLVTLGEGKGDNWWCVLFPPLCLLEAEAAEEVEYKFFVKEIFANFFKH